MKKLAFVTLGVALAFAADAANAVTITSLPNYGSADWTDVQMSPGNTANNGSQVVMTTTPGAGNWFGWGSVYGDQPAWTPGNSADGNYLSFTARFGANGAFGGPKDWTAYLYDQSHLAYLRINPTRCDGNAEGCYDNPAFAGVDLYFADGVGGLTSTFVSLDTSNDSVFEFLLKNGTVSYRINGAAYTGAAFATNPGAKYLIIGDETSPTQTGSGTMTLSAIRFDTESAADVLTSMVPEPATWAMMLGGFGLLGAAARRRRAVSFA